MDRSTYITTTIPYVNADPHLGHALELVQADCFARFRRREGADVFFSTGTDEHGQKIWQKAQEEGRDIQEYVDYYADRFKNLVDILDISVDNFIRTTDEYHIEAAAEMWRLIDENGDVYKKEYTGLYCVGCEAFVTEKDLEDGKCPLHPDKEPEKVEEENYFFRFSRYEDALRAYLEDPNTIIPDFRRKEALAFVEAGLDDISISRQKDRLPWGIPVPDDEEQVMYVWIEALTNYISTLGWPKNGKFEDFWVTGETYQFAGKDQIRFQSLIWQALLLSAGLPATQTVFYHGFITSDGHKMSKSIGNVIDPVEFVDEYGADAVRYYLLRHIHPTDDSDMTAEKFREVYNAHLANGIGNLLSRVLKMAETYGVEAAFGDPDDIWESEEFSEYREHLDLFEFNKALDWVWEGVGGLDELIASEEPFKLIKSEKEEDQERAREIVGYCLLRLWDITVALEPILPETSVKIRAYLEAGEVEEPLFVRK
ncbi:MAG: methionine--tRNA ligase [Candidatus Paceibacterota bacterium]